LTNCLEGKTSSRKRSVGFEAWDLFYFVNIVKHGFSLISQNPIILFSGSLHTRTFLWIKISRKLFGRSSFL